MNRPPVFEWTIRIERFDVSGPDRVIIDKVRARTFRDAWNLARFKANEYPCAGLVRIDGARLVKE